MSWTTGSPRTRGRTFGGKAGGAVENKQAFMSRSYLIPLDNSKTCAIPINGGNAGTLRIPSSQTGNIVIRRAGTFKNLYTNLAEAPGAGTSWTFTLQVNGVDTAITCTVANLATTANDTVNTADINAGDVVRIAIVPTGAAHNVDFVMIGIEFDCPTVTKNFVLLAGGSNGGPIAGETKYFAPTSFYGSNNTDLPLMLPLAGTVKNFTLQAATCTNGTITGTVLINGVATAITATLPAGAPTTASDTVNTVDVVAGDLISIMLVGNAGLNGNSELSWNVEYYPT